MKFRIIASIVLLVLIVIVGTVMKGCMSPSQTFDENGNPVENVQQYE